jgi:REP element-mobilizing transposase RayT
LFGEIVEAAMHLSPEGRIAETAWRNLPTHHRHLALDAFVIMPNHLHGILLFHEPGATLGTVIGGFKSEVSRLDDG